MIPQVSAFLTTVLAIYISLIHPLKTTFLPPLPGAYPFLFKEKPHVGVLSLGGEHSQFTSVKLTNTNLTVPGEVKQVVGKTLRAQILANIYTPLHDTPPQSHLFCGSFPFPNPRTRSMVILTPGSLPHVI
jgi:hypothetical protein